MFNRAGRFNKQPFNRRRFMEIISIIGGIEVFVDFESDYNTGLSFETSVEVEVELESELKTGIKLYATIPVTIGFPPYTDFPQGDSLIVDGFDIKKVGAFLTRGFEYDALPAQKNKRITIVGKHGQVDLGFKLDRRLLEPTIHIEPKSYVEEVQEILRINLGGATGGSYWIGSPTDKKLIQWDDDAVQILSMLNNINEYQQYGGGRFSVEVESDFLVKVGLKVGESRLEADMSGLTGWSSTPSLTRIQEYSRESGFLGLEEVKDELVRRFIKKPLELVLTRWPNKLYLAEYSGPIPLRQWIVDAQFDLPLKMSDPYVYSTLEKYGVGGQEIENNGEETHYTLKLYGPSITPAISLNEHTFYFVGEIPLGSYVEFDTRTMTAWMNGVDVTPNMYGEIPFLPSGTVQVNVSTGLLVLSYRERWLF